MPTYKANKLFFEKCNFLRVRNSRSTSGDNVVYKVKDGDFHDVEWEVDEHGSDKQWHKIEVVRRTNGSRVGGPGWVLKEYDGICTLIPKSIRNVRPNTPASNNGDLNRSLGSDVHDMVERAAAEGRGGLNANWMRDQFQNRNLRRATFDGGAVAWEYKFDGTEFGRHVRVVKRHGIVADAGPPGRGVAMAHAVHAAAGATAIRPSAGSSDVMSARGGFTADVIVSFLDAIPGAVKAHRNAGYTTLENAGTDGMPVMYHQECKLGKRPLSEQQVRQLWSKYVK